MVQHLVLMTIARRSSWLDFPAIWKLHRSRIARLLLHPVSCWLAGTVVVLAWNVPAAHQLTMSSPTWALIQQVSFLDGGFAVWRPVMARGPANPFVPLYLLLAISPATRCRPSSRSCGRVVYGCHQPATALFGPRPADQQCAGALMWFWVTIAYWSGGRGDLRLLSPRPGRRSIRAGRKGGMVAGERREPCAGFAGQIRDDAGDRLGRPPSRWYAAIASRLSISHAGCRLRQTPRALRQESRR